jgi:hypothetical protein
MPGEMGASTRIMFTMRCTENLILPNEKWICLIEFGEKRVPLSIGVGGLVAVVEIKADEVKVFPRFRGIVAQSATWPERLEYEKIEVTVRNNSNQPSFCCVGVKSR